MSNWKEYRKTATIRAMQWWPPGDKRHDDVELPVTHPGPGQVKVGDITFTVYPMNDLRYSIKTLEGWHELSDGDWIAIGIKGERWPIKPDIFAATYEEVQP